MHRPLVKVLLVVLAALSTSLVHAEEIVIGSGTSVMNNILKPVKEQFEKATGHALILAEIGPEAALKGIVEGRFQAAAVILNLEESRAVLQKGGKPADTPLASSVLGSSRTVAIVHKSNPVVKLSKEQLGALLTGKAESWKEVGGADVPVLIVLGKMTAGINKFYYGSVLNGAAIPAEILSPNTGIDVRSAVSVSPEAIGLVVASVPDASVKVPEQPEAVSNMYLYTKGPHGSAVQQLVDFIKGPGQALVKK